MSAIFSESFFLFPISNWPAHFMLTYLANPVRECLVEGTIFNAVKQF